MPLLDSAAPTPNDQQSTTAFDALREALGDRLSISGGQYATALLQAEHLAGLNQFDRAAALYRILLLSHPQNAALHRALGICLERLNHLAAAEEALSCAIAFDPRDARALLARAGIRARRGDRAAAGRDARAALRSLGRTEILLRRRAEILIRTCPTEPEPGPARLPDAVPTDPI